MKALLRITLFYAVMVVTGITVAQAQRVLKGTVYMDGKPAPGINVEAQRGGSMMTSFDGKYEVEADAKTKWIRFTSMALDEKKTLDIEGKTGDVFDFAFTGELPSGDAEVGEGGVKVNLSSAEELAKAGDRDYSTEFSLYYESYKNDDFKSAFPHWKIVYNQYPKATVNIYIHGANMYEYFIKKAASKEERNKWLNEYMKMYDKRIKYFPKDKGEILARKGTAWLKYNIDPDTGAKPEDSELSQIYKSGYEWINESIKLEGNKSAPSVLYLFMRSTVVLYKLKELPKEQVVKNYEITTKLCNEIITANEDPENVKSIEETVLPYAEKVFGESGAADCEVLEKIYAADFDANKDDIDYIKTMLRRLGRANCTESELFAQATERLYQLDPSAEAAFNMARRQIKKGDIAKAKEYYKMAMEQETDQELLASYYLEYGQILYSESAYPEARTYARKVLEVQPNNCDAFMLIGKIYMQASSSFPGENLEKTAIFWLASDYFEKARRSEDCSIEAAQLNQECRKRWPDKEEAFLATLKQGDSYKIGGWINETTKARF